MKIIREILWVTIAFIIAAIIQIPIIKEIDYDFIAINTFIIVFSVIYLRFNLKFENTIGKTTKWVKYLIFSLNFFILVVVILKSQKIIELNDIFSLELYQKTIRVIDINKASKLIKYINTEFMLSAIMLIANALMLNAKILRSFWQKRLIKDY